MVSEYLSRGDAPFDDLFWEEIDHAVASTAKRILTARKFLPYNGSASTETLFTKIDGGGRTEEFEESGFAVSNNRKVVEIPQLFADFWLYWRDIAEAKSNGAKPDLGAACMAALKIARLEDTMAFYGIPNMNIDGLFTVKGSQNISRADWTEGENAFIDVAKAVEALESKGHIGRQTLVVSSDLFVQLQRIQPGTGVLESERIEKLLTGKLVKASALKPNTAALISTESYCLDLLVGQDIKTAYLEAVDLNHHLRIMETAVVRIKIPESIVIFK